MKGVSILDIVEASETSLLADVLDTLREDIVGFQWRISSVECLGEGADEFHRLSDAQATVDTPQLYALAKSVCQIIDGNFTGYRGDSPAPKIVIRAVDSSAYDVEAEDEHVLATVRQKYPNVVDIPE